MSSRDAIRWFANQIDPTQTDPGKLDRLLLAFTEQFPNCRHLPRRDHRRRLAPWLDRRPPQPRGRARRAADALGRQPQSRVQAIQRRSSKTPTSSSKTAYPNVTAAFPDYFAHAPARRARGRHASSKRCARPSLASPDSLTGQLEYIREHWTPLIGDDLRRVLLAIDVLREEDLAIWLRFHPPGPDQFRHGAPQWGDMGFVGDEFIGFDEEVRRRKRYVA